MWYVYILKSQKYLKSYVGSTNDIKRRLKEHNNGRSEYSRRYKPWYILKLEQFNTAQEARIRERSLKSGVGREEMKAFF